MKVEGRCHCGQITYEAEIDPDTVSICHCTDCQTLTGSVFRATVQAPAESFVLRTGQPKIYLKTADSGTQRAHAFCAECGTPIYAAAVKDTPRYSLRLGAIKERGRLRPTRQIWCDSALAWAMDIRDVERLGRQ